MLVLLTLAGAGMYVALARGLDGNIRAALNARSDELAAAVAGGAQLEAGRPGSLQLAEPDETFTQVLGVDGSVLYQSGSAELGPVLSAEDRARAAEGPVERVVGEVPGLEHRVRLVARPVSADDDTVVVAAASLEDRDDALQLLAQALVIGGPVAVALAALLGYLLAAAALSPVDRMRKEAAEISGERAGLRLSRPVADDELRRLADTLNELLSRIDSGRERERGFIADASHELRTPLGILKAEIELALTGERSPEQLRAALASAAEETDALADLTSDLLTLARAEDGRIPLRREETDLAALIRDAIETYRDAAAEAGRGLVLSVPESLRADVDRTRILQAVRNLLDNALIHGEGQIRVSARPTGTTIEIAVEDSGAGVPADVRDSAFERFSRARTARARPGSGLGLAIVRAVAEAHGGEARLGEGARAEIVIPVADS